MTILHHLKIPLILARMVVLALSLVLWGCSFATTTTSTSKTSSTQLAETTTPNQSPPPEQTIEITQTTTTGWGTLIDNAQKLLTMAALAIGGTWTYYRFIKGRTFRPRLEPKIIGSVTCNNNVSYLLAVVQLKNVGLSKLTILQTGTALSVFTYQASPVTNAISADDKQVTAHPIFDAHGWIEPGETIEDQRLLAIPGCQEHLAFRLELRLVSRITYLWLISKNVSWKAVTIVNWTATTPDQPVKEAEHGVQTK
jgi:hypothetical protein